MKVAIYARYSTDQQDKTSIAGQIANCEALAAREQLSVVARYQDEGISGNDDSRPGYQKMLTKLESGAITGIVCDETSRITRNQSELHRLVAELNFRDQFLISGDGIDTRLESSELLLAVKAAVDAMEGRKIGYRTYRSLRERHKAGHSAGGRIYGYTSVQDGDYRRRVIEPEQAKVVREIFERYVGGESAKTIVRDLNERGVRSPGSYYKNARSKGWPHTTLLGSATKGGGVLRNSIYKGLVTWNKRAGKKRPGTGKRVQRLRPEDEWVQYQDNDLRIVSDDLWNKAQARLKAATTRSNGAVVRGRPPRYLLTGLLKCESCGSSYIVRNGRSYCCSSQTNGRDVFCNQPGYIKRELIEAELLGGIKNQLLDPKMVKTMARQIRKRARAPRRDYKTELSALEGKIQNIVDSLVAVGKSEALTSKLRQLESERANLIATSKAEPAPIAAGAADKWAEIVTDLENLRDRATAGEIETARGLLREIIGEVVITEKPNGIFAYAALNASGYKAGAQERT